MKNSAFNPDFDIMMRAADMFAKLNDIEISNLNGMRDVYGIPIQFGDPLVYLHFPNSTHYRSKEIEFFNFINVFKLTPSPIICENQLRRHDMILGLIKAFPDIHMLSEINILRASNDYEVIFHRKNHLILSKKH